MTAALITSIQSFIGLEPREVDRIRLLWKEKFIKKGDCFLAEGQVCKYVQGERFGRLVTEQVFIQTLQDLTSFYTDGPEYRYERFIKKHPDLQQRISQYHIASYVGVKPQSLSRIRKRISNHK